jgi:transcriptional regulator GlxA family with amidase domain
MRTSQAGYIIPSHLVHTDPLVHKFERWARQRLAVGFSLDQAAAALATQQAHTGAPHAGGAGQIAARILPGSGIERAVHLLETSQASVDQVATDVGYAQGVTLRALLCQKLGRGVREIRRGL